MAERREFIRRRADQVASSGGAIPQAGPEHGAGAPDEPGEGRDIHDIETRIERTREEMGHTINSIRDRLSPDRLRMEARERVDRFKAETREKVRDATVGRANRMAENVKVSVRSAGYGLVDTIRENPIPAVLAGIGIGWLLYAGTERKGEGEYQVGGQYYSRHPGEGLRQGAGETSSTLSETAGEVRERLSGAAEEGRQRIHRFGEATRDTVRDYGETARRKVSETAERLRGQAGEIGGTIRTRTSRTSGEVRDLFREFPLAAAAGAMILGAAIGLTVPGSEKERELLGDAGERLKSSVREKEEEVARKVRKVADEGIAAAKEEARRQDLSP